MIDLVGVKFLLLEIGLGLKGVFLFVGKECFLMSMKAV